MYLLSFIRTADPTKVKFVERQRVEDEPRLLESTVGRVVPLLSVSPARASSELKDSVDKIFDDGASGDGQGADIQPVIATTDTIVEDVAPLQPRRQRKRKIVVADASGPSHPPKKLKEDYGALGGAFAFGKSMFAVQSLFTGAVLNAEARGEPIPTLPFITSSVSATPEREDKSLADSVIGLNLQTIGDPQRFVISSDSSHHSGANIAEAEVDSIVRSFAPAIAIVTIVTATVDADTTAGRVPVEPSLFGVGSSSTGRTDSVPTAFSMFLVVISLLVVFIPLLIPTLISKKFTFRNGVQLMYLALMTAVRMRAKYNIREKRRLKTVVDEQAELLKVKDGEIESLKAQLLLKEAEAAEAIRLRAEVRISTLEPLFSRFFTYFYALILLQEVNENFDKLCADFVDMALHLEEKFYPHLLTIISGRRWLLTHGMELAVVRCLNSTEYLSALGAAISKAVEKGMQEGLSVGITHGAEGMKLADVAAYNPSAEADYLSALQRLQNVNFSLIAKLKSNKDASVDIIMNLLRLDDALAERLGLTESQPHANQLMVPIHHSLDQRVVGAFALSLFLLKNIVILHTIWRGEVHENG
uniref:Transposase (Putative), gypsy type n=1 Tax=Tanacetum cinerariifolium TaxID=118510 RepID=A0A6L2KWA1_TANCI|nr:hypothetical protein [Tanacetum cinerariifolium]